MTLPIEGTNDSSCLSKFSAALRGYFKDDFLYHFAAKYPHRAPLIHLGYSVRVAIINSLVENFVSIGGNEKQIVSFGAGFDTLYFKLKTTKHLTTTVYVELDLPLVVRRKINCIKLSDELGELVGKYTVCEDGLISDRYKLLAINLKDTETVKTLFRKYGLDIKKPTLFLSECAITYLEDYYSSRVINLASEFDNATFITYEQIHPDDGFGLVMVKHFMTLQCPLQSVEYYPTLDDQTQRYIDQCWEHCTSLSALDAYFQLVPAEERKRVLKLEPFDEWEELYLKCVHYAVVIASKGSLLNWTRLRPQLRLLSGVGCSSRGLEWELVETEHVSRYGHSVVRFRDHLLVIGGFGVRQDGTHGRLEDITWLNYDKESLSWKKTQETQAPELASMYSSWTPVTDDTFIVYGGRRSPIECRNKIPSLVTVHSNGTITSKPLVEKSKAQPRWRHSAVVANKNNVPTYVVFGGKTYLPVDDDTLGDTWMVKLEPQISKVVKLSYFEMAEYPCARFSHSAAVRQMPSGSDEIWVSGGMTGEGGPLGDLWCLDLATLSWKSHDIKIVPRAGHSSSVHDDFLILVGGFNSVEYKQPGIAVVDLLKGFSVEYYLPTMNPETSVMLINHCHVLCEEEEKLWIVGGGGNCFSFGTFFNSHVCSVELDHLIYNLNHTY